MKFQILNAIEEMNKGVMSSIGDEHYETVADEVTKGDIKKGLWAKAFAEASGDEVSAKALYLRLRAEQLENSANKAVAAERKIRRKGVLKKIVQGVVILLLIAAVVIAFTSPEGHPKAVALAILAIWIFRWLGK